MSITFPTKEADCTERLTKNSGNMALVSLFRAMIFIVSLSASSEFSGRLMHSVLTVGNHESCDQIAHERRVNCRDRNLDAFPGFFSPDIQKLDLSYNNIREFSRKSLQNYSFLEDLNLAHNKIRVIKSHSYFPLKYLIHISLAFNTNLHLQSGDFFRGMEQLSKIELQGCRLRSIPNDTLHWLPGLTTLYLYDNDLTYFKMTPCGGNENLTIHLARNLIEQISTETVHVGCPIQSIDLSQNPINQIQQEAVSSLLVESLQISNCKFTIILWNHLFKGIADSVIQILLTKNDSIFKEIPVGLFSPLFNSSLSSLDFTHNGVQKLHPSIFSNMTVKTLYLNANKIKTLEAIYFDGMRDLRILHLERNEIGDIGTSQSNWTVGLEELHLTGNKLAQINPSAFYGLNNLTLLDLSDNYVLAVLSIPRLPVLSNLNLRETLLNELYINASVLKSLNLAGLRAQKSPLIPGETFKFSPLVESLNLFMSNVGIANIWNSSRNVSLFRRLTYLSYLNLDGNGFEVRILPTGLFANLSHLKELHLKTCNILVIEFEHLQGLKSLELLNLEMNDIRYLSSDLFRDLKNLRFLDIGANAISVIEDGTFRHTPLLERLTIGSNELVTLNQKAFAPLKSSLKVIDLSVNPISCTCNQRWLVDWLYSLPIELRKENETTCSSSSLKSVSRKPLSMFHPADLCSPDVALICSLLLAFIGVVAMAWFMYYQRWALRYRFFLLRLAVQGYEEIQDAREHGEFEYDLNIIFSEDDDADWVRDHLRLVIEDRLPNFNRNVFGENDLILGMHILDAVQYAIDKSFKTVVLLSRAAIRDNWFIIKFRMVADYVSDTETEHMVVVFLEDIPTEELPYLVRLYLSHHRPYHQWVEDERGQRYFWDKLVKRLKVNVRCNNLIPPQ